METYTHYWWLLVLRGVFALLFGVLTIIHPGAALATLVVVFGAYALANGVAALVMAFRRDNRHRGWSVFEGIVGVAAGALILLKPGISSLALYAFIAAWAVTTGIAEIALAIYLRREIEGEGWLIAQGILSTGFGVLMVALPAVGIVALVALIASYAFIAAAFWVALGFEMSRLGRPTHTPLTA
jgi:uncharacterized membrane protein HdeD (DUF308 family)